MVRRDQRVGEDLLVPVDKSPADVERFHRALRQCPRQVVAAAERQDPEDGARFLGSAGAKEPPRDASDRAVAAGRDDHRGSRRGCVIGKERPLEVQGRLDHLGGACELMIAAPPRPCMAFVEDDGDG